MTLIPPKAGSCALVHWPARYSCFICHLQHRQHQRHLSPPLPPVTQWETWARHIRAPRTWLHHIYGYKKKYVHGAEKLLGTPAQPQPQLGADTRKAPAHPHLVSCSASTTHPAREASLTPKPRRSGAANVTSRHGTSPHHGQGRAKRMQ